MRFLLLSTLLILTGSLTEAAQTILPEPLPSARYEQMLEKSPFALATPPAPVQEKAPPVFANLVLTGVVPMRNEQGTESYFVSIQSRDRTERFQLFGSDANAEGIAIASVDWSPQVGKSTVTLKKGSEFGKIEFDEMALQAPSAPVNVPRPGQGNPGGVGIHPGGIPALGGRQPAGGRMPVPRPNGAVQPAAGLPRPGGVVQPQAQQLQPPTYGAPAPGAVPPPLPGAAGGDNRRRIRVINSKP